MKNIVELKNYYFSYDGKNNVFNKFNFAAPKNTFLTIVGNTSCGKTTLAKILSGTISGYGSYKYLNKEINDNELNVADEVSVVIGDYNNNITHVNVKELLLFPLENLKYKKEEMWKSLNDVVKLLKIEKYLDSNIVDLDYSVQKKIILASALISKPKLLVLDDFFINTNIVTTKQLLNTLKTLNKNYNLTIINITHDINESLYGEQLQVLFNDKIVIDCNINNIIEHEKKLKEYHYELPNIIDLSNKLKCYNMINKIILDIDRLVKAIWK